MMIYAILEDKNLSNRKIVVYCGDRGITPRSIFESVEVIEQFESPIL